MEKGLKLAGFYPIGAGFTLSAVLQSNPGPTPRRWRCRDGHAQHGDQFDVPLPGDLPGAVSRWELVAPGLTTSTLTVPVVPFRASMVERITQLDVKVQRPFRSDA